MSERLRWKKRSVSQVGFGSRPSDLTDGARKFATVFPYGGNAWAPLRGWFWITNSDVVGAWVNTSDQLCATEAQAKAECSAWVRRRIARPTPEAKEGE